MKLNQNQKKKKFQKISIKKCLKRNKSINCTNAKQL